MDEKGIANPFPALPHLLTALPRLLSPGTSQQVSKSPPSNKTNPNLEGPCPTLTAQVMPWHLDPSSASSSAAAPATPSVAPSSSALSLGSSPGPSQVLPRMGKMKVDGWVTASIFCRICLPQLQTPACPCQVPSRSSCSRAVQIHQLISTTHNSAS